MKFFSSTKKHISTIFNQTGRAVCYLSYLIMSSGSGLVGLESGFNAILILLLSAGQHTQELFQVLLGI